VFKYAFERGDREVAAILAKNSNNFSTERNAEGHTMLYEAVGAKPGKKDGGNEEGVKFLLDLKVKIEVNGPKAEVLFFLCSLPPNSFLV